MKNLQVEQDDDLIFANRFGVLILSPIENREEQKPAINFSALGAMVFVTLFVISFWAGILYWWLK
jgi:hypothetical protein